MREDLGLAWGIDILRLFTDRFAPEVRVRTSAYERMCEGPVMADCSLLHPYVSECLNDRFRRKLPFGLDRFAHCLYSGVSTSTYEANSRHLLRRYSEALR